MSGFSPLTGDCVCDVYDDGGGGVSEISSHYFFSPDSLYLCSPCLSDTLCPTWNREYAEYSTCG